MKTEFERRNLELQISEKKAQMDRHYRRYQTACELVGFDVLADSERDFQIECYLNYKKELLELKRNR